MEKTLDIIVFGASGYTGKIAISQVHKLAKNLTWGIAGRSEIKLRKALRESVPNGSDFSNIPHILADVEDEDSVKKMTAKAKIIINCCGPYDVYGEVVIKSCIETSTHYIDVTAEIHFMNRMLMKYGDLAEEKGVYIVSACGYGYLPTDLGICYVENNFTGTLNSVETYTHWYDGGDTTHGALANLGTWKSAINLMANVPLTFFIRNLYTLQRPSFKPNLHMKLVTRIDDNWACFCPASDMDVVYRSQKYFYEHNNKRPVHMYNYIVSPLLIYIILGFILVFVLGILSRFNLGRSLLLRYPKFFTYGLLAHLSSEDRSSQVGYAITFKCQGWSDKLPLATDQYQTPPNKEIIARISGVDPAYGFTSRAATLSALTVLTETNKLPSKGGVYTPAIAFSKTSLVQQLQNNGVVFEVISIKDIP